MSMTEVFPQSLDRPLDGPATAEFRGAFQVDCAAALSGDLTARVTEFCERVEDRPDGIAVLHLEDSAPAAHDWPGPIGVHQVNKWERALRRLERLPAPTVVVAGGDCSGPALEILLAADYRIATADLRLSLPFGTGHFWPGMAVHRLAQQIGIARARRLVLFGHPLTGAEGTEIGLFDELVADLAGAADAVANAGTLLGGRTGAELAVRRGLLLDAATTPFEEALGAHLAACDRELRRRTA
jgi:isomerase DpgB